MLKIKAVNRHGQEVESLDIENPSTIVMVLNTLKYACSGTDMVAWLNSYRTNDVEITIKDKSQNPKQGELFEK